MKDQFPRGSEWRKWDLHIHTPASFHWNGGKRLSQMNANEKDLAIREFIDVINNSDVSVFCIMDYWTFDWCIALKEFTNLNPDLLQKAIFFGMELRVDCPVDYRLNVHVILSNLLSVQTLNDFKSELKISIGAGTKNLSDEALIQLAKSFDKSKAGVHGYGDPNSLGEEELLELGSKTAKVTRESLKKAFSHIPKDFGFVFLPYDTSDGLLKLDWKKHPQDDNYFMQSAHIFESRDERNIDLFKLKKTEANKEFFENFSKTLGGTPKPCVSGSDAHKYSDYGSYPSDRITWIKADPTFEGLKQIIYEPSDRVKIQALKPDEKEGYRVIDRVQFVNDSFMQEEIVLNQNLNVIIGSRSSGKSTLLAHIAHTIDPREVGMRDYKPAKGWSDFKVYWKDGKGGSVNEQPENRGVVYIPQNHINKLADSENEKSEILSFIEGVLFLSNGGEVLLREKEKMEQMLGLINTNLKLKTGDLFSCIDLIEKQNIKIKSFGDKKGVTAELEKITNEIKVLNTGITEAELKTFNEVMDEGLRNKQKNITYTHDLNLLKEYKAKADEEMKSIIFRDSTITGLQDESIKQGIISEIETLKATFISSLNLLLKKKIAFIESEIKAVTTKNEQLKKDNAVLLKKGMTNKTANLKDQDRQKLKAKLLEIEKEEKILHDLRINKAQITKDIFSALASRKSIRADFAALIIRDIAGINYSAEPKVDVQRFEKFFETSINYHFSKGPKNYFSKVPGCIDDAGNIVKESLLRKPDEVIEFLFEEDEEKKLKIKTGTTLRMAVEGFLEDYEFVNYLIKYEDDDYKEMTPGKKALVVLKLLIESSTENCPILIDQPEDDLDSRSIYTDISNFLREKKVSRQIIIVTHNANIAIGADAEEVIVANRHGAESPNPLNTPFHYLSGSLESSYIDHTKVGTLNKQGIQGHACSILEGGKEAFEKRRNKYSLA